MPVSPRRTFLDRYFDLLQFVKLFYLGYLHILIILCYKYYISNYFFLQRAGKYLETIKISLGQ